MLWSSRRTGWWSPCACKLGRGRVWWAVGEGVGSRDPGVDSRVVPRHGRAGRVLIPGLSLWDTRSFCKQVMRPDARSFVKTGYVALASNPGFPVIISTWENQLCGTLVVPQIRMGSVPGPIHTGSKMRKKDSVPYLADSRAWTANPAAIAEFLVSSTVSSTV